MNDDTSAARDKLWKMIKDIKFAMFTTRHGNGHLHARPMTTQNKALEADESLWFFMSKSGDPVDDIKADPTVNVVYANPSSDTYVSVSGTAAMIEDAAKKEQLWGKLGRGLVSRRPERPRPRARAGADRPRQLLGREGEQARPALRDGQGRGHRQAADAARRARRSAHALSAQSVTRRRAALAISAASTALFGPSRRGPARYGLAIHCGSTSCDTLLRHCTSRTPSARLPPGGAIEWEELPSLAQRVRASAPASASVPWDSTRPAELDTTPASLPFREPLQGVAIREVNEPDVFRHFFGACSGAV